MLEIFNNKKDLISKLINPTDVVLDVGFWGQGVTQNDSNWVHALLKKRAREVYGIDLDFDTKDFSDTIHYKRGSAESFDFETKFDVIFAGDIIEHLSNPGLFLDSCKRNLKTDGRLIVTTPNCFNLFSLAEKITKDEPTVNKDHTMYFNKKTIQQLFTKNELSVEKFSYVYSLDLHYKESIKKRILNFIYYVVSRITPKFLETLVVVVRKSGQF